MKCLPIELQLIALPTFKWSYKTESCSCHFHWSRGLPTPDGVNAGSLVVNWLELKEKPSMFLVETSHVTQFTGVMMPVADSMRTEK